jgi:hypothetical protein
LNKIKLIEALNNLDIPMGRFIKLSELIPEPDDTSDRNELIDEIIN